jgi:Acetyltransferase (GNAT) family
MVPNRPVVGMIAMHIWQRMRSSNPLTCYIHDLAVSPYYRNVGIAKKIVKYAVEEASKLGIRKIDLACERDLVDFYTGLGFSSVGAHLVKYLDPEKYQIAAIRNDKIYSPKNKNIQEKGEWIYGQDLILDSIIPYSSDIIVPKHFFIPKPSSVNLDLCKVIHESKASFSVKYSLRDSRAFSHQRLRGENSSRGRVLHTSKLSSQEIAQSIKNFADEAPESCAGIVLQEFIDQSGGCLFHAAISKENIDIETLWENSTARAFSRFTDKSLLEYEEILGKKLPANQKYECRKIYKKCKDIFKILAKIHPEILQWLVEGFWKNNEEKLIVLQLRPTPHDKPASETRDIINEVYSTNFSWGNYETPPLEPERLLNGGYENIILRKESKSEIINPNILTKLTSGEPLILVDLCRGFNLSHEKWFLPPPHLRNKFSFIHIPYEVLLALKGRFKVVSSGNKGYIVLVNEQID